VQSSSNDMIRDEPPQSTTGTWGLVSRQVAGRPLRLNTTAFSQGIEAHALQLWRERMPDQAIDLLRLGTERTIGSRGLSASIDTRLMDLLAGLLCRANRQQELLDFAQEISRHLELAADYRDRARAVLPARALAQARSGRERRMSEISERMIRWTDEESDWQKRWRKPAPKTWNGLDI
jgi:hypothetical protein